MDKMLDCTKIADSDYELLSRVVNDIVENGTDYVMATEKAIKQHWGLGVDVGFMMAGAVSFICGAGYYLWDKRNFKLKK